MNSRPSEPVSAEVPRDLVGKIAVITGSTSGIGRAIALRLARAGADCLVHGRQESAANQVAEEVRSLGGEAGVVLADLSFAAGREMLLDEAFTWRPRIDIWINSAGADVLTSEAARSTFEEKLELLWRVDVEGTIQLSRAAGEKMRKSGGVILNMGWDQAEQGMAGDSGEMFAAAKGAVMAFSRSLAQSLAPSVRVNCLAPGWIRTDWGSQASDHWQARAVGESLLGRWGTPDDVAAVAHFLASPAASFVNGQVISINGGRRLFGGPGK